MPVEVTVAVLAGAFLHAAWNALVRAAPDPLADTLRVLVGAALLAAACLPFLPALRPAALPWLAASVAVHVVYFAAVAGAYRHGELGLAYPLMRGTAPLLVAVAGAAWLGERPAAVAIAGIGLVGGGLLLLAGDAARRQAGPGRAVPIALGNAVVIAAYTLLDGLGARHSGSPFAYACWLFLLTAPALWLAVLAWRGLPGPGRRVAGWTRGLLGGACSLAAYALALWAMARAPIALVAALRETSVLFAVLLGALCLRERVGPPRVAAALAVAAGAAAIHLG